MKTQIETYVHQDQKYLVALMENDTQLIEEIYLKCSSLIGRLIIQNNGTLADAEDVFQDALISMYQQSKKGFSLVCPIENFMYLICKRKWINKLRRRKIEYRGDFIDIAKFSISENSVFENFDVDQKEKEILVKEKFMLLSPSCKEIIKLSWNLNENGKYYSWKEIASDLDLSYGYVRKKASECKSRLIKLVKKDPNFIRLK